VFRAVAAGPRSSGDACVRTMGSETVRVLLGLLAAHVCGDAFVYSRWVSGLKRSPRAGSRWLATAIHCGFHAVFVLLFLWPLPARVRLAACLYVCAVHFLIDTARVWLERKVYAPEGMVILSKQDLLRLALGRARQPVSRFFRKNMRTWVGVNALDQAVHLASLIGFAVGIAPRLA